MPKIVEVEDPETLRPYLAHGVDLTWKSGGKQADGECPFCASKFTVEIETGKYRCFGCKITGNSYTFIRHLWSQSFENTDIEEYTELVEERGYLNSDPLVHFGFAKSVSTQEWILPGYNQEGEIVQLYRCVYLGGKRKFIATPTLKHGFYRGVEDFDPERETFYVLEGSWDAPAFWEIARHARIIKGEVKTTENESRSIAAKANVIGVPGITAFMKGWIPLFGGKEVIVIYDNDHAKKNPKKKGELLEPPGMTGIKYLTKNLYGSSTPPEGVYYVRWGEGEYEGVEYFDPELDSGYDCRDHLTQHEDVEDRVSALDDLLQRIVPVEDDWVEKAKTEGTEPEIELLPCSSYRDLVMSWRKAMKWTDGLQHALTTMLACIASTKAVGSQLWIKVIGPASCGKSTLCEAVSANHKYVKAVSSIRGFHSGYGKEGEDNSLVKQLYNKTLVTKDGDTLLQSPNLGQILSEARDIYDGTSRTHYRNKMGKSYSGLRMTWILGGTSSLRSIDQSELGERFLDCVIMEKIDDELEDEILMRVAHKADRTMSMESKDDTRSQHDPDLMRAMQLTGGYIDYLRENAPKLLAEVENPDSRKLQITRLGKFVAFMRARPSKKQTENAEREFAARLVEQHTRLAKCTAVVMNKKSIDDDVMKRVYRIAMDTARGQTLDIARQLYKNQNKGIEVRTLATAVSRSDAETRTLLRFLKAIGVAEPFTRNKVPGVKGRVRWRLTKTLLTLYEDVMMIGGEVEQLADEPGEVLV